MKEISRLLYRKTQPKFMQSGTIVGRNCHTHQGRCGTNPLNAPYLWQGETDMLVVSSSI